MALSVIPIQPPSCLAGQSNGKLDPALLWSTPGLNGGPTVRLVEPAARAWRALSGTAQAAGIILQATSLVDSYRPYEVQRTTFVARYAPEPTTYGCKRWDAAGDGFAELWCKKDPSYATAATPGTSNHGWGLAVDVANAAGARLDWLEAHAVAFGWSWELPDEEPWHIHYWAGDAIPPAVLAYEEGLAMALTDVDVAKIWAADVIPSGDPANPAYVVSGFLAGLYKQQLATDAKVTAIAVKQDQILAALASLQPGGLPTTGPVDLTDEAVARVADAVVDEQHDRLAQ